MPVIYISNKGNYNPMNLRPYSLFNKAFTDTAEDLENKFIKIYINNKRQSFTDGFTLDRNYCNGITLSFAFSRITSEEKGNETILIHHDVEFKYDTDFLEVEQDAVEEVTKRASYLYIPAVKHLEISNQISAKSIHLMFDALTNEEDVQAVSNQLISQDIAIFSRGW